MFEDQNDILGMSNVGPRILDWDVYQFILKIITKHFYIIKVTQI